jgi:hypothetical protein
LISGKSLNRNQTRHLLAARLFTILFLCLSLKSHSQENPEQQNFRPLAYGISYYSGSAVVHSEQVSNIENVKLKTVSFEIARQFTDSGCYRISRTYPRKGFAVSYSDMGTSFLGRGLSASYFFEPVFRVGKKLQFQLRGEAGIGYFTSPYDSIKNPLNQNYSMRINTYMHVLAGGGYHIGKKITARLDVNFHHISNGNFRQPNAGLNWRSISLALLYYPESNQLPAYKKLSKIRIRHRRPEMDIGFMFTPRQGYHTKWKVQRQYMAGIFLLVRKQITGISVLTAGTDLYYNRFIEGQDAFPGVSKPDVLSGVHIGHEFILDKMIFSQQYGRYISRRPSFYSPFYHRWGLRFRLNKRMMAGFNMKVHLFTADFIDFRFQYRIF